MKLVLHLLSAGAAASTPSWDQYKQEYGYSFNGDDDSAYKAQYIANVARIDARNAVATFRSGVNQFTLFSLEEFQNTFMGELPDADDVPLFRMGGEQVDLMEVSSQDWSTHTDVVNPVKNQGHCSSCWTFAATSVLESSWALASNTLYSLSEQQLMDCAPSSSGCASGGLSRNPLENYYPTTGACDDSSYPYTATDSECAEKSCNVVIPAGSISGFTEIGLSIAQLQAALMDRPIKVSVYGDEVWQDYKDDIAIPTQCYDRTNHAVLAVGFESGSYWKIRNSWGPNWGEGGYIRLTQDSQCDKGPSALWGRTPIYPTLSSISVSV